MSNKITRADTKEYFRKDIDIMQTMSKLDEIFDYIEALEMENKRLYQKNNTVVKHSKNIQVRAARVNVKNKELEFTLAEHNRLHSELNDILHQNTEKPINPSLCDLIAYVEYDLKNTKR